MQENNFSFKEVLKYGASALYASCMVQFLHPLDVIRTRLQSHDGKSKGNIVPHYGSIRGAIKGIYREEGLRGFTKGIFVSLFVYSIGRTLFFSFYEPVKYKFYKYFGEGSSTAVFLASFQASFLSSILTQPLWTIQTRIQLNTAKDISGYQNLMFCLKQIYQHHGIKGYYRGFLLQLMLSIHGIVQINSYELILRALKKIRTTQNLEPSLVDPFISGLFSKAVAIYVAYPIITVRTRIQQNQFVDATNQPKYKNSLDVARRLIKEEGVRGFYRGVTASLLKGMPSKGIYFLFYEQMKSKMNVQQ